MFPHSLFPSSPVLTVCMVFKRPMHLIMALEGPNGCVTVVIKPARPNALIFQLWPIRPYSHFTSAPLAFPVRPDKFGRQTLSFQAVPPKRKAAEVAFRCFPALYPPPGTSPNLFFKTANYTLLFSKSNANVSQRSGRAGLSGGALDKS